MDLSRFPRIRLGHLPTPLEPMPNLTTALGGPRLWIKRDDCTGLSTGGNKTRKLEFSDGRGSCTSGGHGHHPGRHPIEPCSSDGGRGAKLGMKCFILLEDRTGSKDPDYTTTATCC